MERDGGVRQRSRFPVLWLTGKSVSCELTAAFPPLGLRKLEAFFGFLITVMALTFGYEASVPGYSLAL